MRTIPTVVASFSSYHKDLFSSFTNLWSFFRASLLMYNIFHSDSYQFRLRICKKAARQQSKSKQIIAQMVSFSASRRSVSKIYGKCKLKIRSPPYYEISSRRRRKRNSVSCCLSSVFSTIKFEGDEIFHPGDNKFWTNLSQHSVNRKNKIKLGDLANIEAFT